MTGIFFPSRDKIRWLPGLCLHVILALLLLPGSAAPADRGPWRTYKGAWFAVSYPADFAVRPAQRSATSTAGYDSVFFASPDGLVQFYVFSPQWLGGEPDEIEVNPATETMVEDKTQQGQGKRVRWVTVRAKNQSYYKSFVDTVTDTNTRTIFGFIYRDQDAYQKYRPAYLRFKQSLRQYAD